MHAFIDESIREGSYRLTMVTTRSADLGRLRRAIRQAAPAGSMRTHLSAEGPARRRQILTAYARLSISAVVYRSDHRRGTNEEPARKRCLLALLGDVG